MTNPWKVSTFVLAGVLALAAVKEAAADQPNMQKALASLLAGKADLEAAATDHGGHRVKAIAATDTAIAETRAGIEWARTHP